MQSEHFRRYAFLLCPQYQVSRMESSRSPFWTPDIPPNYFVLPTLCSIINGLDQDGENFIFGVDISYALYHALCRCQRERMNGIFMY